MLYLRMTSVTVSSAILSVLAFMAASNKIVGDFDPLSAEPPTITTAEEERPRPPPPAPKNDPPPPPPVIAPSQEVAATTPIPVGPPVEATPQPPTQIIGATWLKKPGAREFDRYYPARASQREKEGRVVLNCAVNADGTITCTIADETPGGWGFGEAALQIAKSFKMAPQTANGQPTSGGVITVPLSFKLGG